MPLPRDLTRKSPNFQASQGHCWLLFPFRPTTKLPHKLALVVGSFLEIEEHWGLARQKRDTLEGNYPKRWDLAVKSDKVTWEPKESLEKLKLALFLGIMGTFENGFWRRQINLADQTYLLGGSKGWDDLGKGKIFLSWAIFTLRPSFRCGHLNLERLPTLEKCKKNLDARWRKKLKIN